MMKENNSNTNFSQYLSSESTQKTHPTFSFNSFNHSDSKTIEPSSSISMKQSKQQKQTQIHSFNDSTILKSMNSLVLHSKFKINDSSERNNSIRREIISYSEAMIYLTMIFNKTSSFCLKIPKISEKNSEERYFQIEIVSDNRGIVFNSKREYVYSQIRKNEELNSMSSSSSSIGVHLVIKVKK